ncbi:MAG: hypothetical protein RIN55_08075 [Tissierellaceae bacterium]|nr:hypothetical protein [Tissierellaceae bacterium]
MIKKVKKKYRARAIVIILFISILLVVYFRPRTLSDTLGLEDVESDGTTYCGFYDIIQLNNESWSGTVSELLGKSNELFGPLLHEVSISGPVFYKNAVINPDLVNLYFALPKEDGTYKRYTVELILSYGYTSDVYSAFINIDNRGYFVTSGKSVIASFIQKARNIVTDSSSLPLKVVD